MQFETEIKKEDNIKTINSVMNVYSRYIDIEDREPIKNESLWYCVRKYDISKNMKFTTFLHKIIRYKCLTYIRDKKKAKEKKGKCRMGIKYYTNYKYIDMMIDMISADRDLLIDRYISKMTIAEMSKKYGKPCERIRLEILKIIEKIKKEK